MRFMSWLGVSAALVVACSGSKNFDSFDDGGSDGSQSDDGGPITKPADDSGCAFCGVDSSPGDDSGPFVCTPDPANFEIPGNGCDDDGDGQVDNVITCDNGLAMTGPAGDMAKALGLCQVADSTHWGVVSASYTNGYGSTTAPDALQTGILSKFGNVLKPREGSSFGVLSSGAAREYDQCDIDDAGVGGAFKVGCSMQTGSSTAPPGFPKNSPACPNIFLSKTVNDLADLKLQIKVPKNAKGFSFDFDFGSGEWPEYVCSKFNDSFIAYLTSQAFNGGNPDNISFDANNNPVSVNNAFFDHCSPGSGLTFPTGFCSLPSTYCGSGDSELQGTGFYDVGSHCLESGKDSGGGMTGWLTTQSPVQPGETITLEFMVWDTGDHQYDSSVILDKWQWVAKNTSVGTNRPVN